MGRYRFRAHTELNIPFQMLITGRGGTGGYLLPGGAGRLALSGLIFRGSGLAQTRHILCVLHGAIFLVALVICLSQLSACVNL